MEVSGVVQASKMLNPYMKLHFTNAEVGMWNAEDGVPGRGVESSPLCLFLK